MDPNTRELLIEEISCIKKSLEREQIHFERMFAMNGQPRYQDWANIFKNNVDVLNSIDWDTFEFTQDSVTDLYRTLTYSCACDITSVAYHLGLDEGIDYSQVEADVTDAEEERDL